MAAAAASGDAKPLLDPDGMPTRGLSEMELPSSPKRDGGVTSRVWETRLVEEGECAEPDDVNLNSQRVVRHQSRGRHVWQTRAGTASAGMMLAAALVIAAVVAVRRQSARPAQHSASAEDVLTEVEHAGVFQQCNGNGIVKPCSPGCLCEMKNGFFWWCKPVDGLSECNVGAAKAHLAKAKAAMEPLRKRAEETANVRNTTETAFAEALADQNRTALEAAKWAARKADTATKAMMDVIQKEHEDNVTSAEKSLSENKKLLTETEKEARAQGAKRIKDAEGAIVKAQKSLNGTKISSKKEEDDKVAAAERAVQHAKDEQAKMEKLDLQPMLKERQAAWDAEANRTKAIDDAFAAAAQELQKAIIEKESTTADAQDAAEKLNKVNVEVKKWENAVEV